MMSTNGLTRRLERLELGAAPSKAAYCTSCGLEHARKLSLEEVRALIRVGMERAGSEPGVPPLGPFCLCSCCKEYRGLAELTHSRGARSA